MSVLTSLPEFKKLNELAESVKQAHMRDWFENDPNRASSMQLEVCGIFLDYSKNRVSSEALNGLFDLARACNVEGLRDAMFAGEQINSTEGRAVPLRSICPQTSV